MTQLAVARRPLDSQDRQNSQRGLAQAREPCPCKALETLYRCERPRLLAFLEYRVGKEQAADLVQEVFVKAAASGKLTELRNPRCYLFRIARNLVIDEARKRDRRIHLLPLFDGCDIAQCGGQEDQLHVLQTAELIEKAMAELPDKTATIFRMNRINGKSYRRIHQDLGIALATVDYHMMKALNHLRERLGDHL